MCLFVQNQNFQRHTEFMLNSLYTAGAAAAEHLVPTHLKPCQADPFTNNRQLLLTILWLLWPQDPHAKVETCLVWWQVSMNTSLAAHSAALGGVSSQLATVAQQQEGIVAAAEGGLAALQDLHARAGGLDVKLQHSLQLQARDDTSCPASRLAVVSWDWCLHREVTCTFAQPRCARKNRWGKQRLVRQEFMLGST